MFEYLWIFIAIHLYWAQWGRRLYWRQVRTTLHQR